MLQIALGGFSMVVSLLFVLSVQRGHSKSIEIAGFCNYFQQSSDSHILFFCSLFRDILSSSP